MNNRTKLTALIAALAAILLILVAVAIVVGNSQQTPGDPSGSTGAENTTAPSDTSGTEGSSAPTETEPQPTETEPQPTETEPQPTETEPQPTETEPQPTEPQPTETQPGPSDSEYIGTLYTRGELEAMENEGQGYGPGSTKDGKRPPYADPLQKKYGQYAANFIAPDNGNVYLTFDCGYEYTATDANGNKYRVTEKILDVLKEKNVKAVFFVTMYYCKDQPDLVQRMIDEGHVVGNHTNNHPVMPKQTIDKMVYEIMSLHDYVKDKFGYEMTLFRFPTGEFSTRTLAVVQTLGYKTVHWSFAYGDYDTDKQPEINAAYNKVTGSHHSGAIYLLHAISTTNAAILGDAIDFFRAEGYNIELFQ